VTWIVSRSRGRRGSGLSKRASVRSRPRLSSPERDLGPRDEVFDEDLLRSGPAPPRDVGLGQDSGDSLPCRLELFGAIRTDDAAAGGEERGLEHAGVGDRPGEPGGVLLKGKHMERRRRCARQQALASGPSLAASTARSDCAEANASASPRPRPCSSTDDRVDRQKAPPLDRARACRRVAESSVRGRTGSAAGCSVAADDDLHPERCGAEEVTGAVARSAIGTGRAPQLIRPAGKLQELRWGHEEEGRASSRKRSARPEMTPAQTDHAPLQEG
jgi:hypothetical protein